MDRTQHDMRNDLAVAIGTVHALIDGKLEPNPGRLADILSSLESLDAALVRRPAPNEDLLNAVIEGSPYAKVLVNGGGRIVLVNGQAEALFGYSRDELLGMSIDELVPERFRHGHRDLRDDFAAAPSARAMGAGRDLYGRRKDASEVPIEIGLNPIVTGGETFTLAAITDISERKHSEELRLANLELADASRFKTEFVSTMSHELRTPLASIIAGAELLSRMKLDERAHITVQTMTEASEALLTLINSVLDFSKIEAGKLELQVEPFEIEPLLEGVADVLAHVAREKNITLNAYVDPSIPAVLGDRDRVRQILFNLVGNAVKFTESGRVVVRAVSEDLSADEVLVRFDVQDTGIGIPSALLPLLFEPFAQADRSASRKFAGTGLGLSISKRLVEMMGGRIGVESTADLGSSFWFALRFARASGAAGRPAARNVPATESLATVAPTNGTVLVAEDNEPLRRLLKQQFEDLGVAVTFVFDGRQALEAIRSERYAMVFMDCQMPNLDGLDATKLIRHEERLTGQHLPITAMTANAFAEDRAACLAAGMDDYLSKPVKLADLRAKIERWT